MTCAMKRPRLFLLAMAELGFSGALYLSGVLSAQSLATPNFTTAQAAEGRAAADEDVMFLTHMIAHHRQAIEMAALVPARSGRKEFLDRPGPVRMRSNQRLNR